MKPSRRSRLLVDRLQYRILAAQWIYFLALVVVFAGILFLPLTLELGDSTISALEREQVAQQFLSLHAYLWPAVAVLLLLLTGHSIFMSHRIAGPLVRFRHRFRRLGEGDLGSRIRLRDGDYLTAEAELLNDSIGSLSTRIDKVHRAIEGAEIAATGLARRLAASESDSGDREALRFMMEELSRARGVLDGLQLPEQGDTSTRVERDETEDAPAESVGSLSGR